VFIPGNPFQTISMLACKVRSLPESKAHSSLLGPFLIRAVKSFKTITEGFNAIKYSSSLTLLASGEPFTT